MDTVLGKIFVLQREETCLYKRKGNQALVISNTNKTPELGLRYVWEDGGAFSATNFPAVPMVLFQTL